MVQSLILYADAALLMIFGVGISASFLGIRETRVNTFKLGIAIAGLSIVQIITHHFANVAISRQTYPLLVHVPLIIFFMVVFKKRLLPSTLAVVTAYLSCQVSKWLALAAIVLPGDALPYELYHLIFLLITGILIIRYASASIAEIFAKDQQTLIIFGILPLTYYIFDYVTTVFSQMLYQKIVLVSEFMPFIMAIMYLIFCVVYYRQLEQATTAHQRTALLEMQKDHSIRTIELMQRSEREISIMRHDMRHFLDNLASYIKADNREGALAYIDRLETKIDETAPVRYCSNELINMVLDIYDTRIKAAGIEFDYEVKVGERLPCSEIDFTSLLSNALENALNATTAFCEKRAEDLGQSATSDTRPDTERAYSCSICLRLETNDSKLLLSLTNPYEGEILFKGDLPVSLEKGHGIGTESILYVTRKLEGSCQFFAQNGIFTLRIIV